MSNLNVVVANRLHTELISDFVASHGSAWVTVQAGCMEPLIRDGDEVHIESMSPERIRFLDIIVFQAGEALFAHRVVGKRTLDGKSYLLQKGDRARTAGLVSKEACLGKVVLVKRSEGRLLRMDTWPGSMMNRGIGIVFYLVYAIRKASRRIWRII